MRQERLPHLCAVKTAIMNKIQRQPDETESQEEPVLVLGDWHIRTFARVIDDTNPELQIRSSTFQTFDKIITGVQAESHHMCNVDRARTCIVLVPQVKPGH